ncbi:MAG: hypothetical protein JJU00_19945 [Opitutales bacterium]|nr:hypothetical protein [Opitutales bacterium]
MKTQTYKKGNVCPLHRRLLMLLTTILFLLAIASIGAGCGRIRECPPWGEPSLQARSEENYHASRLRVLECLSRRGDPNVVRFLEATDEIAAYYAYLEGLHDAEFEWDYVNDEALAFMHGKSPEELISFAAEIKDRAYALGYNLEMKRRQKEADEKGWDIELPLMPVP